MLGEPYARGVVLVSDAFGGFGGIAKFNRDFLAALSTSPYIDRVLALPRLIPEPIREPLPEFLLYDRAAAGGKANFTRRVFCHALSGPSTDFVVCGHINLLPLAWILARRRGARLTLVIHGIEAWEPHPSYAVRALTPYLHGLISVSRYSEKKFRKWAGANKATTLILPNCVDLDTFVPRPKNPSFVKRYGLNGAEVLLTVGRLATEERYKGIDEVIELMPKLLAHRPKLRYLIVGDGSDRARLEAKASVLGVAHAVIFAGRIPEEEKVDHYNLASVYVMPSTGEGFGIVLIEAAACGLTIVGSAVDGSREALLEGTLGTLTDPRDLVSLEQTILESLDKNSERSPNPAVKTFGEHAFRERVWAWSKEQSRTTGHGA